MEVYWPSIFILPPRILKEVEGILKAFLWAGAELKKSGAKVQWLLVCSPKPEGGLGFKPPKLWNKAIMIRHLWALSAKADSLWVKWVHTFVIKNRCLWNVKLLQGSSWTVRKMFKLREMAQPLIRSVVGDSSEVFLWFDNWHPLGPL